MAAKCSENFGTGALSSSWQGWQYLNSLWFSPTNICVLAVKTCQALGGVFNALGIVAACEELASGEGAWLLNEHVTGWKVLYSVVCSC